MGSRTKSQPRTFTNKPVKAVELWPDTGTTRAHMLLSSGREVRNVVVVDASRPVTFEYESHGRWYPARTDEPFAHLLTWLEVGHG